MARTKISEFSATAADNTDIDNIDIAEGCAPSGINNAIRELMAQLKDFQTGAAGDPFNGAVNGTVGATTPAAGTFTNLAYTGTLTGGTGVINIGSGQVYKDASGNVGVGVTPSFRLDVGGQNGTNIALRSTGTGSAVFRAYVNGAESGTHGFLNGGGQYFEVAGTEAMRLDANRNLGLGVTPSASWQSIRRVLQVGGSGALWAQSSGAGTLFLSNNTYFDGTSFRYLNTSGASYTAQQTEGSFTWNIAPSGTAGNTISFTQAMTLDANGKLEISTGEARLDLKATNASGRTFNLYSGGGGNVGAGTFAICEGGATQRFLIVGGGTGESARINASGNLLVGIATDSGGSRLRVRSAGNTVATNCAVFENSSATNVGYIRNDGAWNSGAGAGSPYNLTTGSAANLFVASDGFLYRSTSSLKYKTDVQDSTRGLADVMNLRPVTYKGKNDGDTVFGGLIAEEVHEAGLTEFVQYAEDGSPDALAYGNMVSLAFKAIQEQQAIITELKAEFDAYKAAHP